MNPDLTFGHLPLIILSIIGFLSALLGAGRIWDRAFELRDLSRWKALAWRALDLPLVFPFVGASFAHLHDLLEYGAAIALLAPPAAMVIVLPILVATGLTERLSYSRTLLLSATVSVMPWLAHPLYRARTGVQELTRVAG